MVQDGAYVEIESCVNPDGKPFCVVSVHRHADGECISKGQLSPEEVRKMAMDWLGAAEAAEQDSMVLKMLQEYIGLEFQPAIQFVGTMRAFRQEEG